MKDRQLFENLDTSFVKLDALVRHLCRLNFVGTITLSFDDLKGEIKLTPTGKLRVTERDEVSDRSRTGQTALEHIMIRADEPGGSINVIENDDFKVSEEDGDEISLENQSSDEGASKLIRHVRIIPREPKSPRQARATLAELAEFPFELANNFEPEAAFPADTDLGLELMIDVVSDLLSTIDDALDRAGLDFSVAFQKACADVSDKFPFLDPEKRLFRYSGGLVYISSEVNLRSVSAGVGDVLRRIFERLGASSKFENVHRFAVKKVHLLAQTRKEEFSRTGMLRHVERAISREKANPRSR